MKQILNAFFLGVILLAPLAATAATPSQNLGNCMVDNLNGKERKDLAKWIFFSMAAHPDIKPYLNAKPAMVEASNRFVGKLITRLLTVNCAKEFKTANAKDPNSIGQAFRLVGQVAMKELMTNKNVTKAITGYIKYADKDKINALMGKK